MSIPLSRAPAAAYSNVQRLNDDLFIAQRGDQQKGTWYLHKLGRKSVRRSLGTEDIKAARTKAFEAYRVWQDDPNGDWLAAIGSTRHHVGFKQIAEEWLDTQTTDRDYKADVIRKFLIPFFHDERAITSFGLIDDVLIADYKLWRLNFWKLGSSGKPPANIKSGVKRSAHYGTPSANTLNRENPTLRQILACAAKKGCFGGKAVPVVATEAARPKPRPAFLGGDFDKLAVEAAQWIEEAKSPAIRQRRQLLADWIWVARLAGIRLPHEGAKLTWGDVRLDTKLLHIAEETKTGRRDVPLNEKAAQRLAEMRERRLANGNKLSGAEHVFLFEDGTKSGELSKMFNQLVARCEFPTRADGTAYSPYSLRHTFATFSLAEGMTGDHVAEIMGTSVKMLNNHYKHGTIEQTRRYLKEKGLMSSASLTPQDSWRPLELGLVDIESLPPGDWRRKRLILADE